LRPGHSLALECRFPGYEETVSGALSAVNPRQLKGRPLLVFFFFLLPTWRTSASTVALSVTLAGAGSVGFGRVAVNDPFDVVTAVSASGGHRRAVTYEKWTVLSFLQPLLAATLPLATTVVVVDAIVLGASADRPGPADLLRALDA